MLTSNAALLFAVHRRTFSGICADVSATSWSHSTMFVGWLQFGGEQNTILIWSQSAPSRFMKAIARTMRVRHYKRADRRLTKTADETTIYFAVAISRGYLLWISLGPFPFTDSLRSSLSPQ